MNIKEGYQIQIDSWENDGDFHMTKIISGLTAADVKFWKGLCEEFTSANNPEDGGGYGNTYNSDEVLTELFTKHLEANPEISQQTKQYFVCDKDVIYSTDHCESVDEFLGRPMEEHYSYNSDDSGTFCRVFDGMRIYYFPTEIKEISDQF